MSDDQLPLDVSALYRQVLAGGVHLFFSSFSSNGVLDNLGSRIYARGSSAQLLTGRARTMVLTRNEGNVKCRSAWVLSSLIRMVRSVIESCR